MGWHLGGVEGAHARRLHIDAQRHAVHAPLGLHGAHALRYHLLLALLARRLRLVALGLVLGRLLLLVALLLVLLRLGLFLGLLLLVLRLALFLLLALLPCLGAVRLIHGHVLAHLHLHGLLQQRLGTLHGHQARPVEPEGEDDLGFGGVGVLLHGSRHTRHVVEGNGGGSAGREGAVVSQREGEVGAALERDAAPRQHRVAHPEQGRAAAARLRGGRRRHLRGCGCLLVVVGGVGGAGLRVHTHGEGRGIVHAELAQAERRRQARGVEGRAEAEGLVAVHRLVEDAALGVREEDLLHLGHTPPRPDHLHLVHVGDGEVRGLDDGVDGLGHALEQVLRLLLEFRPGDGGAEVVVVDEGLDGGVSLLVGRQDHLGLLRGDAQLCKGARVTGRILLRLGLEHVLHRGREGVAAESFVPRYAEHLQLAQGLVLVERLLVRDCRELHQRHSRSRRAHVVEKHIERLLKFGNIVVRAELQCHRRVVVDERQNVQSGNRRGIQHSLTFELAEESWHCDDTI
mmetsp:Transcript_46471/g.123339  ORF Transcript_46471/g.123339 Transcript_46471/m.123339 type:complete len:514 (-) Transcript_46471:459-2000(-)